MRARWRCRASAGYVPPMRAALLLLACLAVTPAWAQSKEDGLDNVLRAVSAMAAIAQFCPPYYRVDEPLAVRTGTAMKDAANKVVGKPRATRLLDRELRRRFEEVKVTGDAQWCRAQRAMRNEAGVGDIFLD